MIFSKDPLTDFLRSLCQLYIYLLIYVSDPFNLDNDPFTDSGPRSIDPTVRSISLLIECQISI